MVIYLIVYKYTASFDVDSSCRRDFSYLYVYLYQFGSLRSLEGVLHSLGLLEYTHRI